ncbi:MAG: hypothetical protein AAFP90_11675 [Planctomycetota bacterium]
MKSLISGVFAALLAVCFVSVSVAGEPATCCSKTGVCSKAVASAMEDLPKMTFLVGKQETCCSQSAAALAKKADKPVQYLVSETAYKTEAEAFDALVVNTEGALKAFTTPHTCKVSGTTTIAGEACSCSVKAGQIATKVRTAVNLVSMQYKVGNETCSCPTKAASLAKASGKAKMFVVAGKETTCAKTARLELARAKYKAAVEAYLAMKTPAPAAATVKGSNG